MKRFLLPVALLVAAVALPAEARIFDVTAWYGWVDLSGDTTIETIDASDIENLNLDFDSESGFGLGVNIFLGNRLSFAASAYRFEPAAAATANNPNLPPLALGNLELIPVTGVLQLHLLPNSTIDPYVGVGVGYVLVDDIQSKQDVQEIDVDRVRLEDDFGIVFNAGVSIDLFTGFALNLDAKYIPLDSAATVVFLTGPDESTNVEVNPLILSAGLSFQF